MENKELIINLIQQDLKHNQLLLGLKNIGLGRGDLHYLRILDIVCKLMDVPEGDIADRWGAVYSSIMEDAINYEITSSGESLRSLAEACYSQLKAISP